MSRGKPVVDALSTDVVEERLFDPQPTLPVDHPALTRPGDAFITLAYTMIGEPPQDPALANAYAAKFSKTLRELYHRALYDPDFVLPVKVGATVVPSQLVAGHKWGYEKYGPSEQCDVMVIGKMVGEAELIQKYNFAGQSAQHLYRAIAEAGVTEDEYAEWYCTNLVRHGKIDPSKDNISAAQIKNCLPLLLTEIALVRPKFILCLGVEAAKALLGRAITIVKQTGKVETIRIPIAAAGEPPEYHEAQLMVTTNPASVHRRPEQYAGMFTGVAQFVRLIRGKSIDAEEKGLTHVCVYTEKHLASIVDNIIAESSGTDIIAVDCEWHGDRPGEPDSYLRTIQFSHKPKYGYCIVLRKQGGKPVFRGGVKAVRRQLLRLFKSTATRKVRIGGHFFRADLPWLLHIGVDVLDEFEAPPTAKRTKYEGGWDTGYMAHSYREAADSFKLEVLGSWLVGTRRYDADLQRWKEWYCSRYNLKDAELEGYGECPDHVLHPYAILDADVTRRLFDVLNGVGDEPGLLDKDEHGNSSRLGAWVSHRAAPAFLEMEMTGVTLDRNRGDTITAAFVKARDEIEAHFREKIGWVELLEERKGKMRVVQAAFNANSAPQCRDLLFGSRFNGVRDKITGRPKRLRPAGVQSLGLTPIKASGSKGKLWEDIVLAGQEDIFYPSTDKEVLGILSHVPDEVKGRVVRELRDLRFISQVLKGVLRKPKEDDGGDIVRDEDGNLVYDGGLMYWLGFDGRVRTHFYPVETGRCSSSRPALQNISKRRESDYARILGYWDKGEPKGDYLDVLKTPRYTHKIRSMVRAAQGCVLVEADYKVAELSMIGWLAQDTNMIERVRRNSLPENDPDYLDLHTVTAMNAFRLDTPENREKLARWNTDESERYGRTIEWGPYKFLLEKILKLPHLRVAAKNVNFGVPYQRTAEAIARQCREEGVNVSEAEAQILIDEYFASYPSIGAFLEECKARAIQPGFLRGPFGRWRRFQTTNDPKVRGEMQRQACNFPIQNGVADALSLALGNLCDFRKSYRGEHSFKMCLQIHDALLFEVPIASLDWFMDDVVEQCMSQQVDIFPRYLDGAFIPNAGPYRLGVDTEVFMHWGEKIPYEVGVEQGVNLKYCTLPPQKKAA